MSRSLDARATRSSWWSDTRVYAGRNLRHIREIPEKLLDVTLQPLMFVLLFAYVFGGAIAVQGSNYREYLIAGILLQSLAFGLTGPATAIATDLTEGVIDRFRSLPSARSAYLSGHVLAELAGMGLSIVILLASGLLVGWRTHTDPLHVGGALGLLVLFAATMVVAGTLLGLLVRTPDAVMGVAFTVIFPLTFISNAFVPARVDADRAAEHRRVESGQRPHRCRSRAVRQPERTGRSAQLAARAPGDRGRRVLRRCAGDRRPSVPASLQGPHHRLTCWRSGVNQCGCEPPLTPEQCGVGAGRGAYRNSRPSKLPSERHWSRYWKYACAPPG